MDWEEEERSCSLQVSIQSTTPMTDTNALHSFCPYVFLLIPISVPLCEPLLLPRRSPPLTQYPVLYSTVKSGSGQIRNCLTYPDPEKTVQWAVYEIFLSCQSSIWYHIYFLFSFWRLQNFATAKLRRYISFSHFVTWRLHPKKYTAPPPCSPLQTSVINTWLNRPSNLISLLFFFKSYPYSFTPTILPQLSYPVIHSSVKHPASTSDLTLSYFLAIKCQIMFFQIRREGETQQITVLLFLKSTAVLLYWPATAVRKSPDLGTIYSVCTGKST